MNLTTNTYRLSHKSHLKYMYILFPFVLTQGIDCESDVCSLYENEEILNLYICFFLSNGPIVFKKHQLRGTLKEEK